MSKQKGVFTDSNKKERLLFIIPFIILLCGVIGFFKGGGAAALHAQGAGFWIAVVVCIIIAVVLAVLSKYFDDHGDDRKAIVAVILAVVLFVAPFAKACTDKADPIKKEAIKK